MFKLNKTLFIPIISVILLFISSCDIIDSIFGGDGSEDINQIQEQALTTVITIQDDASDILDNLFSSGMDTLSVIDSLANFFMSDTSVQAVWPDSEGVSVDYNNGISGGVFIGRYVPEEVFDQQADTLIAVIEDDELGKKIFAKYSATPINKNSIIFDGAYPQFKNSVDPIIDEANSGFSMIGISPFIQKLGREATIEVLSTLDQYGIIHLAGHGWYKSKTDGLMDNKITYLLTGEKAEINKTYGDLWDDILKKNVIICHFNNKKENRYWVSPKFVSSRNNFHDKNVFIYSGICSGARGWMKEMVTNAGAKCMVGYMQSVKSNWEDFWARKMYRRMCDISYTEPYEIGECIHEIINEQYGVHYFRSKKVHMVRYDRAGGDLSFWEFEPPLSFSSIRFEYVLDTYWNPSCFATDYADNDYFEFDQYALLVSPISLTIDKIGNSYSGAWDAIYDWGDRWHTGSILFILNDEKTKATLLNLNFAEVNTDGKWNEYDISLKDIDCNYSDTAISLSIKNKQTCNHITRFDLWQDCWTYTNGVGISNLTSVGCAESETANTYYFIQIDLSNN